MHVQSIVWKSKLESMVIAYIHIFWENVSVENTQCLLLLGHDASASKVSSRSESGLMSSVISDQSDHVKVLFLAL